VERYREWLVNHCDEVVMPRLASIVDKGRPSMESNDSKLDAPMAKASLSLPSKFPSSWGKFPIPHIFCAIIVSLSIYLFKELS